MSLTQYQKLINAAEKGDLASAKEITNHDRSVINQTDENGCTALHWALSSGKLNLELVKFFMENGMDPTQETVEGISALQYAKTTLPEEDFNRVLKFLAESDFRNINGDTVLIYAAYKKDEDMVKKLLDYGVDVGVKNRFEVDAINATNSQSIKDLLQSHKPSSNPSKSTTKVKNGSCAIL